jgi:hypothetical protein
VKDRRQRLTVCDQPSALEVLGSEYSAVLVHVARDQVRHVPVIKVLHAVAGQSPQGSRQLRLAKQLSNFRELAILQE